MLLYDLPIDVWTQLIYLLDFTEIVALFETCAPIQRIYLSTSAVRKIHILSFGASQWFKRFFFQLPHLSSVSLICQRTYSFETAPFGLIHPLQFHKTLRSLHLSGYGALSCLCSMPANSGESASSTTSPNYEIFNLGRSLPNLEDFSLTFPYGTSKDAFFVAQLPPTLTSLTVAGFQYLRPIACRFASLPHLPNLTHLSLSGSWTFEDPSHQLPTANLTSLHLPNWKQPIELHTSLERLTIPFSVALTASKLSSPEQAKSFTDFRNLTFIHLIISPRDQFHLPSSLTHLELVYTWEERMVWPSSTEPIVLDLPHLFRHLPSSISRLSISGSYLSTITPAQFAHFLYLPQKLEFLHCNFSFSLTSFNAFEEFKASYDLIKAAIKRDSLFPPSIKDLRICTGPLSSKFWAFIPPSIRRINFSLSLEPIIPDNVSINATIRDSYKGLSLLPPPPPANTALCPSPISISTYFPLLTELKLESISSVLPIFSLSLPSHLTSLDISIGHSYDGQNTFFASLTQCLPPTLKTLKYKNECLECPDGFGLLPPGLTDLTIQLNYMPLRSLQDPQQRWREKRFANKDFMASLKVLPPCLTSLHMATYFLVPASHDLINALPRLLVRLTFRSLYNFDENHFPLLPPELRFLNVNHAYDISDQGLLKLPNAIQYVFFKGNRSLTPKCFKFFPPSLIFLQIPKNPNFPRALIRSSDLKLLADVAVRTKRLKFWQVPK